MKPDECKVIGRTWTQAIASWDEGRLARLRAHYERLVAGGWSGPGGLYVAYEMVCDEDDAAEAGRRRAVSKAEAGG